MLDDAAVDRARLILRAATNMGWQIATAESCTGGLLAACLTAVPGSSAVFERGLVTYTNRAKLDWLGVSEATLAQHGAVSGETAQAMAAGACQAAGVAAGIGITGIAGPSGGTETKPVGLVYIGFAAPVSGTAHRRYIFEGDRTAVRRATIYAALDWLAEYLAVDAEAV